MRLGAALVLLSCSAAALAQLPTVTVRNGVLVGTTTAITSATATVNKFLGVPFAQPPVNGLRFALSQVAENWPGQRNASQWAPSCIQQFGPPGGIHDLVVKLFNTSSPPFAENEDCLYLNVYVPATSTTSKAVMFWIYGGSLDYGTAMTSLYDGSNIAAFQDVIVVAPNYRTNVFGFPASDELPITERNLGFYDQRLALRWVQENIERFGGDPGKVAIIGESSGAASVDRLITAPPENLPFRAAIMESGTSSVTPGFPTGPTGLQQWNSLTQIFQCNGTVSPLNCMRNNSRVSAWAIKAALDVNYGGYVFDFKPVKDGVTTLVNPEEARRNGSIAKVPIIQGTNSQEGRLFALGSVDCTIPGSQCIGIPQSDAAGYISFVLGLYPQSMPNATRVIEQYQNLTPYEAISEFFTEIIYQCPASVVTKDSAAAGIPTWRYIYNASFPNIPGWNNSGAYHSSEIYLVFGNFPAEGATPEEIQLSKFMQGAWAKFAKDPTSGPDPAWHRVDAVPGDVRVGVLGWNPNGTFANVTETSSVPLDRRCYLYTDIYNQEIGGNPF